MRKRLKPFSLTIALTGANGIDHLFARQMPG
jgi:hypothetical protein